MEVNVLAIKLFGLQLKFVYFHARKYLYFTLALLAVLFQALSLILRINEPKFHATSIINALSFSAFGFAIWQFKEQTDAAQSEKYLSSTPTFSLLPLIWFSFWTIEIMFTLRFMFI